MPKIHSVNIFCIKIYLNILLQYVNYFYFIFFFQIDIPGKPGTPEITDWDADRVDLKWTAPKHNGGAPITGYVIEKKEKFSTSWDEILTTDVINT